MEWKEVANNIGNVATDAAPGIAALLAATGVGAPVAGAVAAIGALGRAFGLGSDPKPEDLQKAISTDPEAVIKLRLAEMYYLNEQQERDHEERTQASDNTIKVLTAQLTDVQNARNAEVSKTLATGKRDTNLYVLSWVNVVGFFTVLVVVIIVDMPTSEVAKTALAMLFGALIGGYKDVLGYFFGSSKSSADKTILLANRKDQNG